jgi:phage terminase small subunit
VTIGADGLPFVDMSKIDRDKMAAVQEVHVEVGTRLETNETGEREAVPVRKVRFKLADKRAALVDLGRHLGMFREQIDLNVTGAVRFIVEGAPGMKVIDAVAGPGEAA